MPILKPSKVVEKKAIKIQLDSKLLDEIQAYMKFAHINEMDYFFEQVVERVFLKDREWQSEKKKLSSTKK